MIGLSPDDEHVVLINTFVVQPHRSEELLELLSRATEEAILHLPGFVSANLHKSLDGTRVANYAQWRSVAALEMMYSNQQAQQHMKQAAALADSFEPILYTLRHARQAGATPSP